MIAIDSYQMFSVLQFTPTMYATSPCRSNTSTTPPYSTETYDIGDTRNIFQNRSRLKWHEFGIYSALKYSIYGLKVIHCSQILGVSLPVGISAPNSPLAGTPLNLCALIELLEWPTFYKRKRKKKQLYPGIIPGPTYFMLPWWVFQYSTKYNNDSIILRKSAGNELRCNC